MEGNNEKRVLRVELEKDVKKVSITGMNSDEKVVMRQVLDEDELEEATGGIGTLTKVGFAGSGLNPTISSNCSVFKK